MKLIGAIALVFLLSSAALGQDLDDADTGNDDVAVFADISRVVPFTRSNEVSDARRAHLESLRPELAPDCRGEMEITPPRTLNEISIEADEVRPNFPPGSDRPIDVYWIETTSVTLCRDIFWRDISFIIRDGGALDVSSRPWGMDNDRGINAFLGESGEMRSVTYYGSKPGNDTSSEDASDGDQPDDDTHAVDAAE